MSSEWRKIIINTLHPLDKSFFNQEAELLAQALLGKIICVKHEALWLYAQVIETEAYYLTDKASHASLGFTEKRKALFMSAGTIYMYYAHGADSLNISAQGEGNAVLIKSAYPYLDVPHSQKMLAVMQEQNPPVSNQGVRGVEQLCKGQTLLCKSLGLKVRDWNQQQFDPNRFYIAKNDYSPKDIIQTTRLGIPKGRDEHLPYRFIDAAYEHVCTKKPKGASLPLNCNHCY